MPDQDQNIDPQGQQNGPVAAAEEKDKPYVVTRIDNAFGAASKGASSALSHIPYVGGFLSTVFKAASLATWAVARPLKWAAAVSEWGLKGESAPRKVGAGIAGIVGAAGYLASVFYGSAYGVVAYNDMRIGGLNGWPATQGQWTGTLARFSEQGQAPFCNSWEGNLRTAEAADSEKFSVGKFQTEIIDALNGAGKSELTLVYRDSGLPQEAFGEIIEKGKDFDEIVPTSWLGCIHHTDHHVIGVKYTHVDTGEHVAVGVVPGMQ